MDFKSMPKICVKCKKSEEMGVKILEYKYVRTKVSGGLNKSTTTRSVGISFPVCETCGNQFLKYQKYESFYDSSKRFLVISSFILWAIVISLITFILTSPGYYYGGTLSTNIFLIIFTILGIIFPVLFIILRHIVNTHPNRISQYIEMTQDGNVSIKDEKIREEIIKKVEKDMYEYEHNINVIFCPKCGKKYPQGSSYCSCGKDLRVLQ